MATILLADQDSDTRIILSEALKQQGIGVIHAADAESAHELARKHCVDVIVLNYPMRLRSGVTLTRAIRKNARLANLPILNFTSHVTPTLLADAAADGVTHTVEKPADIHSILQLISQLLDPHTRRRI